jgi:hypothetical protein
MIGREELRKKGEHEEVEDAQEEGKGRMKEQHESKKNEAKR